LNLYRETRETWVSRFGGFRGWKCIFSGKCHTRVTSLSAVCVTPYLGHVIRFVIHYICESYHINEVKPHQVLEKTTWVTTYVSHIIYMKWSFVNLKKATCVTTYVSHIMYWYYSNSMWVTSYIWNEALLSRQESYVRHYIRESHHIYEMKLCLLLKKATCVTTYVSHIIYMKWSFDYSSRKLRASLHTWVTSYIWNEALFTPQESYLCHYIRESHHIYEMKLC